MILRLFRNNARQKYTFGNKMQNFSHFFYIFTPNLSVFFQNETHTAHIDCKRHIAFYRLYTKKMPKKRILSNINDKKTTAGKDID